MSSGPKSVAGLAEGSHTLRVRAHDAAGNVEDPAIERTWQVDLSAPLVTLPHTATVRSEG